MRISDLSSDVCSSDLQRAERGDRAVGQESSRQNLSDQRARFRWQPWIQPRVSRRAADCRGRSEDRVRWQISFKPGGLTEGGWRWAAALFYVARRAPAEEF